MKSPIRLTTAIGVGVASANFAASALPAVDADIARSALLAAVATGLTWSPVLRALRERRNEYGYRQANEDHRSDRAVNPGPDAGEGDGARSGAAEGAAGPGVAALPVEQSDEPIRAYKYATLSVTENGASVCLRAFNGTLHSVEGTAHCESIRRYVPSTWLTSERSIHYDAPHLDCTCGFYALKTPSALALPTVELDVELFGQVIECERGYRAEKQRILKVTVPSRCFGFMCDTPAEWVQFSLSALTEAFCTAHVTDLNRAVSVGQIANRLGTEVVWAS